MNPVGASQSAIPVHMTIKARPSLRHMLAEHGVATSRNSVWSPSRRVAKRCVALRAAGGAAPRDKRRQSGGIGASSRRMNAPCLLTDFSVIAMCYRHRKLMRRLATRSSRRYSAMLQRRGALLVLSFSTAYRSRLMSACCVNLSQKKSASASRWHQ